MWDWLKRLAPRATIKKQIKTQRRGSITTQRTVLTGVDLHLFAAKPRKAARPKVAPAPKPPARPVNLPGAPRFCRNCGAEVGHIADRWCSKCQVDFLLPGYAPGGPFDFARTPTPRAFAPPHTRRAAVQGAVIRVQAYTRPSDGVHVKSHTRKVKG